MYDGDVWSRAMTRWQREQTIRKMIQEKIGGGKPRCFVSLGRVYSDLVGISYFWNDSTGRREFMKYYPISTAKLSEEEIAEMFLMDWVFG